MYSFKDINNNNKTWDLYNQAQFDQINFSITTGNKDWLEKIIPKKNESIFGLNLEPDSCQKENSTNINQRERLWNDKKYVEWDSKSWRIKIWWRKRLANSIKWKIRWLWTVRSNWINGIWSLLRSLVFEEFENAKLLQSRCA